MNVHICPRVHWNRPPFEMDTGFSAIGVANGYWFPLPFHVCWNEVSGIFFFWVGGGSCCFVRKYECAALCSWSKDHTMTWLQKVAVPNIQFRIARCSALIVRMCCNCDRPIRFHTRLNLPNVCSLRTPESIWTHFCVPNSRGRHPASLQSKKSWKCTSVLYVRCWIAGLRCTWRRTRRNFWHNRQPGTLVYVSGGLQSVFGRARCQIVASEPKIVSLSW